MPLLNTAPEATRAVRRPPLPRLPNLPHLPQAHESRPMRIALVTEYYYPHLGGVCEHVHFFAREARRRGHHVDIITSQIPGCEPQPHVIRLGRSQIRRCVEPCTGSRRRCAGSDLRTRGRRVARGRMAGVAARRGPAPQPERRSRRGVVRRCARRPARRSDAVRAPARDPPGARRRARTADRRSRSGGSALAERADAERCAGDGCGQRRLP